MDKNLSFSILVQTSAIGWDGSRDMSMRNVDGKPVLYWVLKKIRKFWTDQEIILAAPIRDNESGISQIIQSLKDKKINLFWGSNDDVLSRILSATQDIDQEGYILRVLGIHYFFDPRISQKLLDHVSKDHCDWAKPSDDYEIQLTSELIKLKVLRDLDAFLKKKRVVDEKIIRISPIHYITNIKNRDSGHIIDSLPSPTLKEKKLMREKAITIYHVDRTDINFKKMIHSGSQLTFHYEIAKEYLKQNFKVLDIASGDGFGSKILADNAYLVVGVDIDENIIAQAQNNYSLKNTLYLQSDAINLLFPDNTFDAIVSMETIEHVNAKKFLFEITRVLKPKGLLILSTPQNKSGRYPINPFHQYEYSLNQLKRLLGKYIRIKKIIGIKTGRLIIKDDPIGTNTLIIGESLKNE